MKTLRLLIAAALTALAPAAQAGVSPTRVDQELDTFVQYTWADRSTLPYKFNEYRSVPNGLVLDKYSLDLAYVEYRMSFLAEHIKDSDQSYKLKGSIPGLMKYRVMFDDTPHTYANQAKSPYVHKGNGYLALPDELQAIMQKDSGLFLAISTGMASVLNDSPDVGPLRVTNETASADFSYHPAQDWTVDLSGSRLHKYGVKPMGSAWTGSPSSLGAIEVPVPIDNNTYELGVGAGYAGKDVQAAVRFASSRFDNEIPVLVIDRPTRLTDAASNTSRARIILDPDNTAHTVSASAGVNLPLKSRLSAEVGYSVMAQDEKMFPYTINSALTAGGGRPFDLSNSSNMPAATVDAKVTALNQTYILSSRGLWDVRGSVAYRSYDVRNKTPEYHFPGRVGSDSSYTADPTVANLPFSYKKDNLDVKADYDITSWLSAGAGYGLEWKKNEHREVPKSDETSYSGSLVFRPNHKLFVSGSHVYAQRRMDEFETADYLDALKANPTTYAETPGLRRFDVGDRNRNRSRVQVGYTTDSDVTANFTMQAIRDIYKPGDGDLTGGVATNDNRMYGVTSNHEQTYGADLSFPLGSTLMMDLYGEYDFSRRYIQSNSGGQASVASKNWTARTYEIANVAGLSFDWKPAGRFAAKVGYDMVQSMVDTTPIAMGSSLAYKPLPKVKNLQQTAKFDGTYKLTENLSLIGRYMFQKLNHRDWADDDIPLISDTTIGSVFTTDAIYLGNSVKDYVAHTVGLGLRYTF